MARGVDKGSVSTFDRSARWAVDGRKRGWEGRSGVGWGVWRRVGGGGRKSKGKGVSPGRYGSLHSSTGNNFRDVAVDAVPFDVVLVTEPADLERPRIVVVMLFDVG